MKTLLLIFIIAAITYKNEHRSAYQDGNGFKQYIQSLGRVSLPLNHLSTDGHFQEVSRTYDKEGFSRFKHAWAVRPLGLLINDRYHIVTVDLSMGDNGLVPLFVSFDKYGNKIDSLGPYELSGSSENYQAIERLIVTKDHKIIVQDTIRTFKDNSNRKTHFYNTTSTTSIGVTYYFISPNGKFLRKKRKIIKETSVTTVS